MIQHPLIQHTCFTVAVYLYEGMVLLVHKGLSCSPDQRPRTRLPPLPEPPQPQSPPRGKQRPDEPKGGFTPIGRRTPPGAPSASSDRSGFRPIAPGPAPAPAMMQSYVHEKFGTLENPRTGRRFSLLWTTSK